MAYTRDQLRTALLAADKAGDNASAQRIAQEIRAMDAAPKPSQGAWYDRPAPKPRTIGNYLGMGTRAISKGVGDIVSMADSLAVVPNLINMAAGRPSFGQAMAGVIDRSSDRRGLTKPRTNAERLGSEFVRGVTASAPMLMAGGPVASQPIRQLLSGGAGYASGEAARQQGAGPTLQTLASLAGGLATYGGASALANLRLGPKAAGAAPRVTPPADAPRVTGNPVAPLGRKAVVRDATLRRAGVQNPTTGMVTRDPRMWNFEQETAKLNGVGDDMQSALIGVQDDLRREARAIVDRNGGAIGPEMTGIRTGNVLKSRNEALQNDITALYKQAGDQFGNARVTKLDNLVAVQSHPEWQGGEAFDKMSALVNKRLAHFAEQDGGAAGLTVRQSDQLRKFIGNNVSNDSQGGAIRKMFQDALDMDVLDGFGGAPFASARSAAKARFGEFKGTMAGEIADAGGRGAERLPTRMMSAATPLSDVRAVMKSLNSGATAEEGAQAQAALGSQILDDMLKKYVPEEGTIKGGQFFAEFQKNAPRLQIILGPQRYKEMRRLAQAARYATADVPMSNVNYSGSASNFANILGPAVTENASSNLLPNLARRAGGAIAGGLGLGPVGAIVGDQAAAAANKGLAARAARTAGEKVAEQVRVARDPAAAARLIAEATNHADPVVSNFAKSLAESMRPVAAIGAAANNNGLLYQQFPRAVSAGETPEDQQRQQRGF